MNKLQEIVWAVSKQSREKRAAIFRQSFVFDETTKILDIGSENGENINLVLDGTGVLPENVFIADIDPEAVKRGAEKFGFQPVYIDESERLPFDDASFDIVYCSSVIEHVAGSKSNIWEAVSEEDFNQSGWEKQSLLANEIRRVGKQYFVQTPARNFPIESHTWLPFFSFLPHPLKVRTMKLTNRFWIKEAIPDFKLLSAQELAKLFPDARICFEKKMGLIKSNMANKSLR